MADAFFVALRLPNHFRAIFAEGAFNAAFVPAYARIRTQGGPERAGQFADRIFTLLLASQIVLLAIALLFMPAVIDVLAPGFAKDPGRYALAVDLTRITFPYLLLITLVTLYGGILNALQRFAAAAAAPILLNMSLVVALALAAFFPTAGHAAAWGVLVAGVLEFLLVAGDATRAGAMTWLRWPELDADVRQFFRALGPATVGSAGVQLALFADTIIASFLPAGAVSALYYADRLNQLPIGVIGIAAGTVILPEMSRRLAAGDETGAMHAQNRAAEFTLLLSIPCIAAFFVIPELIMRGLFLRGAFTAVDATASARTLAAYAFGLLPFVLIRSTVATFFARGDTATPVKAALLAAAVNIAFKVLLMGTARPSRPGARDLDRGLDQPGFGDVVRLPGRPPPDRCAIARIGGQTRGRRGHSGGRPVAVRRAGGGFVRRMAPLAGYSDPIGAGCHRRRRLWRHCSGSFRTALVGRFSGTIALRRATYQIVEWFAPLPKGKCGHTSMRTIWGRVPEPSAETLWSPLSARIHCIRSIFGPAPAQLWCLRRLSPPAVRASRRRGARRRRP